MKIGGNQAEAFPDLPIQPRNLDVDRKTGNIAREVSKKNSPKCFCLFSLNPISCLFSLSLYTIFSYQAAAPYPGQVYGRMDIQASGWTGGSWDTFRSST